MSRYRKQSKLSEEIDDAVEENDFSRFKHLLESDDLVYQDMIDAMDVAYRGTKLKPGDMEAYMFVAYLMNRGISKPNYPFGGRTVYKK